MATTHTRPSGRGDSRGPRRWVLAVLLAGLTGCAPATTAPPAPPVVAEPRSAPASDPAPVVPDVPVRPADLVALASAPVLTPTSVSVPALDVELPIDPVGVESDGQMEIPALAERAGWYRYGSAPGDPQGTAVIAAHVDSVASEGLGPFARLQDLVVGDPVTVTLADGSTLDYTVSDVTTVAKPEIAWDDVFVREGEHRLVLITCGGTFRSDVRSYSDNVIVTAVPVP